MTHADDTHVLVDATGTAVMSGSLELIEREALALMNEGVTDISIRTIDDMGYWDWTMVDWGDVLLSRVGFMFLVVVLPKS